MLFCQLSGQKGDRFTEQVVGILDRTTAKDWLGIYGGFECAFEQTTLLGLFDALSEDGLDLVMQNQMRAEELEGALCAEWLSGVATKDSSPSQIKRRASCRLFVGDLIMLFEKEH